MDTDILKRRVRVLHLEDSETDQQLVAEMLRANGFQCEFAVARTHDEFASALGRGKYDLIVSDFTLPSYDGLTALSLARELHPETPFIFFSGTIGEEVAVDSLKNGATDYVLKQRPHRLIPAIHRALRNTAEKERLHRAERALQQSEERLRIVSRATNDVIWEWDLQNDKISFNENFQTIYGHNLEEAEVPSEKWFDFIHPNDRDRVTSGISASLAGGGRVWWSEHRVRRADGSYAHIFDRASVVYDSAGKAARMVGVSVDITERKQLEERLLRAQRLESLGMLISGIAHDLSNTLAPVLIGAGMLRSQPLSKEAENILNLMEVSAQRSAEMVKQALAFARGGDSGKTLVHAAQPIKEMAKIITDTFPKNIQCRIQIGGEPWLVFASPTQLHQVLMNLCVNASDAMPDGGTLTLAAENVRLTDAEIAGHPGVKPGNYLCITVADTGSGIPADQLEKIFEPFFTTKTAGKGTGLGLPTSQTVVRNHGGFMTVRSEVGRGAEFKIFLPAATGAETGAAAPAKPPPPHGHGECVLVVDDEESVRTIIRTALEHYDYRVLTVTSGFEAVAQFAKKKKEIDLVIADLAMPLVSGRDTIAALRKTRPDVKVIAISGLPDEMEKIKGRIKTDAFVHKPFTTESLLQTVHEVLARKK